MGDSLRSSTSDALRSELKRGLALAIGPFVVRLAGRERFLAERLHADYPNYPILPRHTFADACITITPNPTVSRHWWSTRAIRTEDGQVFATFPKAAMLAHIEWTMNWSIANRSHHFLMLHAGVLANAHGAVIFPAYPGAGKSTLCAYLMHQGWRLLSDEFTLIRDASLEIHPFPRLIPLKNRSIDVIRELVPEAHLGQSIPGTHKGTVAHLRPGDEHIAGMFRTAPPRLMIFPKYEAGAPLEVAPASRADCFVEITRNAFNYILRGEEGFRLATALTDRVKPYRLTYSDLPAAAKAIHELMLEAAGSSD